MKIARLFVIVALVAPPLSAQHSPLVPRDSGPITIHALRLIDGRGRELRDVVVTVRRGRIVRVDETSGAAGGAHRMSWARRRCFRA